MLPAFVSGLSWLFACFLAVFQPWRKKSCCFSFDKPIKTDLLVSRVTGLKLRNREKPARSFAINHRDDIRQLPSTASNATTKSNSPFNLVFENITRLPSTGSLIKPLYVEELTENMACSLFSGVHCIRLSSCCSVGVQ